MALPPLEIIALNRMGYGPAPGDAERVRDMGLEAYVDEQLNPDDGDDPVVEAKLASATLRINYPAEQGWPAVDEERPLVSLEKPIEELWPLQDQRNEIAFAERVQPAREIVMATMIRAAHSKWQLRELMVDFWHNHFNVNMEQDLPISVGLPVYDKDVMRAHCFGNFRAMIEDMTKSVCMEYYLNNVSNKNVPPNENFARELMELHTLGATAYFNDIYTSWEQVPGALDGNAIGFIDDDVRAVARALTGWTIENGVSYFRFNMPPGVMVSDSDAPDSVSGEPVLREKSSGIMRSGGKEMPNTGRFHFFSYWHDYEEKRFLGELLPAGVGVKEGQRVLDKLAAHPATATFIATKLCRRFISDTPPQAVIDAAAATFAANIEAPDQIARTLRTILLSQEFATTWGEKVKRPFETIISFVRALGGDFTPNMTVFYVLNNTGHTLFQYPAPTGHPDVMAQWTSSNVLLTNWNMVASLAMDWWRTDAPILLDQIPEAERNGMGVVNFLASRMLGYQPSDQTANGLAQLAASLDQNDSDFSPDSDDSIFLTRFAAATVGFTPEFQLK